MVSRRKTTKNFGECTSKSLSGLVRTCSLLCGRRKIRRYVDIFHTLVLDFDLFSVKQNFLRWTWMNRGGQNGIGFVYGNQRSPCPYLGPSLSPNPESNTTVLTRSRKDKGQSGIKSGSGRREKRGCLLILSPGH